MEKVSQELPTVVLWKRQLLPATETFIRNQQDAYTRYRPLALGGVGLNTVLSRASDRLLFGGSLLDRVEAKMLSAAGFSPRLKRELKNIKPAVVHAHFAPEGFAVARACTSLKIPLVVSLHGHDINEAPFAPGLRGLRYRIRLKNLFRDADALIAVSQVMRNRAIELGCPPEKVHVRYTGIKITPLVEAPEKTWDILFLGRLVPHKGPLHMLQAAAQVEEKTGRKLKIGVIGEGAQRAEAEELARKHQLDVTFLGHLKQEDVHRELTRSRILCAPSHAQRPKQQEGFGMVFLEAALAQVPSVAYQYGGVVEAVENGVSGILAPEGRVDELSRALETLILDRELAHKLGTQGRERTISEFSMEHCISRIEELYDDIIAARREA